DEDLGCRSELDRPECTWRRQRRLFEVAQGQSRSDRRVLHLDHECWRRPPGCLRCSSALEYVVRTWQVIASFDRRRVVAQVAPCARRISWRHWTSLEDTQDPRPRAGDQWRIE